MQQIPPFYVGQEVEAIVDHPDGVFVKGDRFLINTVGVFCCGFVVTVGIPHDGSYNRSQCWICKRSRSKIGNEWMFSHTRFRAITPAFSEISFSEVMEEVLVSEN